MRASAKWDDYYILGEVTSPLRHGQVKVDPKYNSHLVALADKVTSVKDYMIQVKGYASPVGSVALNQKLCEDRANIMQQTGPYSLYEQERPKIVASW